MGTKLVEYPGDPFEEIRMSLAAKKTSHTLLLGPMLKALALYEAVKESKNECVREITRLTKELENSRDIDE